MYLFTSEIPDASEDKDNDDAPKLVPKPVKEQDGSDSDKPHNSDTECTTRSTKTKTTKSTNGTWYFKVLNAL